MHVTWEIQHYKGFWPIGELESAGSSSSFLNTGGERSASPHALASIRLSLYTTDKIVHANRHLNINSLSVIQLYQGFEMKELQGFT